MSASLFRSVCDIIACWYGSDRVRVAPTTGRLLGLQEGDRFLTDGNTFEVLSRSVGDIHSGCNIVYRLSSSAGDAVLQIVPQQNDRSPAAIMKIDGVEQEIFDEHVTMRRL